MPDAAAPGRVKRYAVTLVGAWKLTVLASIEELSVPCVRLNNPAAPLEVVLIAPATFSAEEICILSLVSTVSEMSLPPVPLFQNAPVLLQRRRSPDAASVPHVDPPK